MTDSCADSLGAFGLATGFVVLTASSKHSPTIFASTGSRSKILGYSRSQGYSSLRGPIRRSVWALSFGVWSLLGACPILQNPLHDDTTYCSFIIS